MAAGLLQIAIGNDPTLELIGTTLASGTTALLIILAICLGLVIPKLAFDFIDEGRKADL